MHYLVLPWSIMMFLFEFDIFLWIFDRAGHVIQMKMKTCQYWHDFQSIDNTVVFVGEFSFSVLKLFPDGTIVPVTETFCFEPDKNICWKSNH